VKDRERERLEKTIAKQEDAIFRLGTQILRLHGGEVNARGVRRGHRGRPKDSGEYSAQEILTAHLRLHKATSRHVTQQALADELDIKDVRKLQRYLTRYGIGWPLD